MNRQVISDLESQLQSANAKLELRQTFMNAAIARVEKLNQENGCFSESVVTDSEKCVDAFESAKAEYGKILSLLGKAQLKYTGV